MFSILQPNTNGMGNGTKNESRENQETKARTYIMYLCKRKKAPSVDLIPFFFFFSSKGENLCHTNYVSGI